MFNMKIIEYIKTLFLEFGYIKDHVFTEEETCILSTHMTFVRIDDEGGPIPISETVRRKFNSPVTKL